MKLDRSKPFGIAFVGPNTYYGQGDKHFDRRTEEEIVPTPPPPASNPAQTPDPQPVAAKKLTCNQCGKVFPFPESLKGRQMVLGKLRAHLKRDHGITVEKSHEPAKSATA
jgi:hypothetical protein